MNRIAEAYVKLALATGQHDADYVDAFYGPAEWRQAAESEKKPLDVILKSAQSLLSELASLEVSGVEEMAQLRHHYLTRQLEAMTARIRFLRGEKMSFDEEARALYDAAPPSYDENHFSQIVTELDSLLPGRGPVPERYRQYRQSFVIPPQKLDVVFNAAITEARKRTRAEVALPEGESFKVGYVTGKSWSGYNWYQGNYQSLIQVNTDLPVYIDRAVDLASHEGYPGHHVYNVLLEENMVRRRNWVEFTVYPLFSPQSFIAEGTANFGIEVVFPGKERVSFERTTLFPLAGLDPDKAEGYYRVAELAAKLTYAGNEVARRYLNGGMDREKAVRWLGEYALMPVDRAEQRMRFIDQYRSYVINYNLGEDVVKQYIESRGGTEENPEKRWAEFVRLLSSPRLPSSLR